jgi:outer membrane protein assembly factor BamB
MSAVTIFAVLAAAAAAQSLVFDWSPRNTFDATTTPFAVSEKGVVYSNNYAGKEVPAGTTTARYKNPLPKTAGDIAPPVGPDAAKAWSDALVWNVSTILAASTTSKPLVFGEHVIVFSTSRDVMYVLHAATGDVYHQVAPSIGDSAQISDPLFFEGKLYFATGMPFLYRLDLGSLELRTSYQFEYGAATPAAGPAIGGRGNRYLFFTSRGALRAVAVNAFEACDVWNNTKFTDTAPYVYGDRVWAADGKTIATLSTESGAVIWTHTAPQGQRWPPTGVSSSVFMLSGDDRYITSFFCNPNTGVAVQRGSPVRWVAKLVVAVQPLPAVVNPVAGSMRWLVTADALLVFNAKAGGGHLVALNGTTGKMQWQQQLDYTCTLAQLRQGALFASPCSKKGEVQFLDAYSGNTWKVLTTTGTGDTDFHQQPTRAELHDEYVITTQVAEYRNVNYTVPNRIRGYAFVPWLWSPAEMEKRHPALPRWIAAEPESTTNGTAIALGVVTALLVIGAVIAVVVFLVVRKGGEAAVADTEEPLSDSKNYTKVTDDYGGTADASRSESTHTLADAA